MSDAGMSAGGAAIYAGRQMKDSSWSCSLVVSKPKMMKATVPRNELAAILMMAQLAYVTKKSLGDRVGQIIYLTDSTIAFGMDQKPNN